MAAVAGRWRAPTGRDIMNMQVADVVGVADVIGVLAGVVGVLAVLVPAV